ncbi:unnamed protein product, partial [Vitis vinifera]|uniref:Uncharacterized protein n=1 Tax=Vitis vinifera TaxID=29760 RepID=D7TLN8_VITVI
MGSAHWQSVQKKRKPFSLSKVIPISQSFPHPPPVRPTACASLDQDLSLILHLTSQLSNPKRGLFFWWVSGSQLILLLVTVVAPRSF